MSRKNSGSYGFDADLREVGSEFKKVNKTLSKKPSINKTLSKPMSFSITRPMTKTAVTIDYDNLMKKFIDEFQTKLKDLQTMLSNIKKQITDTQPIKFKDSIEDITLLIQDSQQQKNDMERNFLQNHQKNTKPYKHFTDSNDYIDALFEIQKTSCNLKMTITDKINMLRDKLKADNNKFRLFTRKTRKPLTNAQQIKKIKDAAYKSGRILTLSEAENEWATNNVL